VQLRSNSRFYQALTFLDGKKRQASLKTDKLTTALKLAEEWYQRKCRASVSIGRQHPLERLGVDPIMGEVFTSYKASLDSSNTRAYADMKWSAMADFWREKTVTEITTQTFRQFYTWRRKRSKMAHLKNHSLHKDMMVVRQVLKFAIEEGHITALPIIPKVGKIEANPRPWLTEAEWDRLSTIAQKRISEAVEFDNPRVIQQRTDLYDFMRFMVASMCRVDEVRKLRFRDCRLDKNTRNESFLLCQVTGKRGTRDIVASQDAATIYTRRLQKAKNPDALMFGDEHHRDGFRELLDDAGLRKDAQGFTRNFKSLRATAISFAVIAGGKNPNLLMIARNAGTSAAMIDAFYAKRLTAELWKDDLTTVNTRAGVWRPGQKSSNPR
jgi:integrase